MDDGELDDSLDQIRVLLIDMAPMTKEFIRDAVAKARDIALMGELPAHAPLVRAVDDRDAHVVIFGTPTAGLPEECADLMNERPRTKVLTVERNGRSAVLYELRPVPVELGQVSPTALLDAIRGEKVAR